MTTFRPIPKGVPPGAPSGDHAPAAGDQVPPIGSPATPVTTERRTPETRIQPGDHVRLATSADSSNTGIVVSVLGYMAHVQWADGMSGQMAWGYLERVPAAVAT